jgi:phosphatidate cytidylyltransferase
LSNLVTRIITGIVFIISVVASLYFDPVIAAALFSFFTYTGCKEYFRIAFEEKVNIKTELYAILIGAFVFLNTYLSSNAFSLMLGLIISIIFGIEIASSKKMDWNKSVHALIPLLWLGIPFAIFIGFLSDHQFGFKHALAILVGVWSNDSMAYVTGRMLGRNKFAPTISPNKTWEGVIGGVVFAAAAMVLLFPDVSWYLAALIGATVGLGSTIGDLVQSFWKRSVGIKDSGKIFPGHGGVLDRFDGFIFAVPVAVSLFYFFKL